jgi:hypothetical protein
VQTTYVGCHDPLLDKANASTANMPRRAHRSILRALLLIIGTGVFLILLSSAASALDVPGSETVDATTEAVGDTTDTVGGTAGTTTGTAGGTAGTAGGTAGTATDTAGTVGGTAGTAGGTAGTATDTAGETGSAIEETAGAVTDVAGEAGSTIEETAGAVTDAVGETTGAVIDVATDGLDATAAVLEPAVDDPVGTISGTLADAAGAVPTAASDPALVPDAGLLDPLDPLDAVSSDPAKRTPLAREARDGPSALRREAVHTTLLFDVHAASVGASRPDTGGSEPGPVPAGGLPFPLDAAAAALSSLTEAGGSSLVWAFLALLVLLPAMDDRWLRFVRAAPPLAPLVAPDGRPG